MGSQVVPSESPLRHLCSDSCGSGIIDLGCTDTLCGERWLQSYLRILVPNGVDLVRRTSNAWFVFGNDGVQHAMYQLDLPMRLAGAVRFLRTRVVPRETPLLIGRKSLAPMHMWIDAASNVVTVNLSKEDVAVPCSSSASGHLVLPLWNTERWRRA